jgi:hypothetical protein
MWERMLEFVTFYRTKAHRKPVDILKAFISGARSGSKKLASAEIRDLRGVFRFLQDTYKTTALGSSRLATDQTYFYTMLTAIIKHNLNKGIQEPDLRRKLEAIGEALDGRATLNRPIATKVKKFEDESKKQTTDLARRQARENLFVELVQMI